MSWMENSLKRLTKTVIYLSVNLTVSVSKDGDYITMKSVFSQNYGYVNQYAKLMIFALLLNETLEGI